MNQDGEAVGEKRKSKNKITYFSSHVLSVSTHLMILLLFIQINVQVIR